MSSLHLSRRQVLAALAACGAAAGCRAGGGRTAPTGPPASAAGSGGRAASATLPEGLLLARRFSFGPTEDLVALAAHGPDAFFDVQLGAGPDEAAETTALLESLADRLEQARAALSPGAPPAADPELRRAAAETTVARTLVLAAWSTAQVRSVLADFLSDHLHVTISEAPDVLFVPAYDQDVIRAGALGSFADLLVASARSSAMLVYLDNARSRADGGRVPNENYARELLELHTVGVDGGYDEVDVVEVAHVFSGWSLASRGASFAFRPTWHDLGPLADGGQVLGWSPSAKGEADGEDLLHHLARLPSTASFLAWKLARRFVADDVTPDDGLVRRLAEVYRSAGTELGPVLRELAGSDEFAQSTTAKVRRPLDLVAAMLRMSSSPPSAEAFERPARVAARFLQALGQVPYQWPAPNGYPESAAAWSGAGALIGRWNTAMAAASGFGGLAPVPSADTGSAEQIATAVLGHPPGPPLAHALSSAAVGPDAARVARALTFASPEFQQR